MKKETKNVAIRIHFLFPVEKNQQFQILEILLYHSGQTYMIAKIFHHRERRQAIPYRISKSLIIYLLLLTLTVIFQGCHPALKYAVTTPEETILPVRFFYPDFFDDMDIISLEQAATNNIEYLTRVPQNRVFKYGPHEYSRDQVIESQKLLLDILKNSSGPKEVNKKIKKHFNIYRAAGRVGKKEVLFTGYFEPIYDARIEPDNEYKYPVYHLPDDLMKINLSDFSSRYKGENIIARLEGSKVVPYFNREEIEDREVLKDKKIEIAWLKDPLDVAFLHIQGSGRLRLADGTFISVGYRSSNGRAYKSIGKYLIEKEYMTREEMSMQGIRKFLSEHPDMINEVLNYNPSYIFFRILENGPIGNIGVPVTPGRTIALDSRLFPKGALCFIECEKPVVNSSGEIEKWQKFSRFMINQDTGGAIKGAGRADIFWGSGEYAELAAGHMKQEGKLYILIKKQ